MLRGMLWNRNGTLNVRELAVRTFRFGGTALFCVVVGVLISHMS